MLLLLFSFSRDIYAAPTVTIENFSDNSDPFSPNADAIDDMTTISATISTSGFKANSKLKLSVSITIRDSRQKIITSFSKNSDIQNNSRVTISQIWDSRDKNGKVVLNGTYSYQIQAGVNGQKAVPVTGTITVESVPVPELAIKNLTDAPDPFSPDGNGIDDTTNITAVISIAGFDLKKYGQPVTWTLIIKNAVNKSVRLFSGWKKIQNNGELTILQQWDGRNFRSQILPDGLYNYVFSGRFLQKQAEFRGQVTIQTQKPLSVSVYPDSWHIGEITPSEVITMTDAQKITVINDGQAPETFSLHLINPPHWQDSQTYVSSDNYILNAAFSQNPENIFWDETAQALSTVPVYCTDIKFAGDQTGVGVQPGEQRSLWLQFKAPASTSITTEQEVKVIITAEYSR